MASFWAAGKNKVASADSSTPTITEAPPKKVAPTQQKKGLVLKGMTNGGTSKTDSANGKMRDWADEDDDECFLAEITKKAQDPRVTTLENTVALQDERVKELKATVITKTLRIEELEAAIGKKDNLVGDLKTQIEEKDAQIEAHETENERKTHEIQGLLADVDNKDARIQELEAEALKKDNTIRELELQSGFHSPLSTDNTDIAGEEESNKAMPTAVDTDQVDTAAPTEKESEARKVASETSSSSFDFEVVDIPKVEESKTEVLAAKAKEEPPEARGPSVGEFPTFITKETLKIVPPPPAPKALKFPIDMSKFGKKKATATQPAAKHASSPGAAKTLNGHTTPWGAASKNARINTDTMPKFAPHLDIRHMSHGERVIFANGPDVIVKLGEAKLATIPKYILMQCSDMALKYFEGHPEVTTWAFTAGSMDFEAAKAHLAWMDEMTYQGRVYSITLNTAPENDRKNLEICRAARVMGLNNTYVGHFTKQLCNRIREGAATPQFLDMVCELAFTKNDPIFECLANNLVNQKKLGQLGDGAFYDKLVAKHNNLKQKIQQIEDKMAVRRGGKKSPEGSQRGVSANGNRNGGNGGKGRDGGAATGGNGSKVPAGGRLAGGSAGFDTTR